MDSKKSKGGDMGPRHSGMDPKTPDKVKGGALKRMDSSYSSAKPAGNKNSGDSERRVN